MLDAMCGPKAAVIVPRATEFDQGRGDLSGDVAGSGLIRDAFRHNAGEYIIGDGSRLHK